eukprot:924318-Alexandrium_andersonii.AAC.1
MGPRSDWGWGRGGQPGTKDSRGARGAPTRQRQDRRHHGDPPEPGQRASPRTRGDHGRGGH